MNAFVDSALSLLKKYSPEILIVSGVCGVVSGVVVACKETLKVEEILEEHNEQMEMIHSAQEAGVIVDEETKETAEYTEKDARKDITMAYLSTGYKLFKLYLPSGLLIAGSIACIIGSHSIMSKRNAGLSAAYISLSESYNNYRKNIIEKYGETADAEARFDIKAKKIKGKNGEEDKVEYQQTDIMHESDFSRFFDSDSTYWDKNINMNLMTIHSAQEALNRRLKRRRSHEISFNEICGELDLRPDYEKGNIVGIKYRPWSAEKGGDADKLDERGEPQILKIMVYVLHKGQKIKKSIDEAISDGDQLDPVMLLDFQGLEPLV